jgi:hypothetical protein
MWLRAVQGVWQADRQQGLLGLQEAVHGVLVQAGQEVAARAAAMAEGNGEGNGSTVATDFTDSHRYGKARREGAKNSRLVVLLCRALISVNL